MALNHLNQEPCNGNSIEGNNKKDPQSELLETLGEGYPFELEKDKNITRGELKKILGLSGDEDVKEGQYLDLSNKGLGPKAAEELVKHLNFRTKGITIDLSGNGMLEDGAFEFMNSRLGEGVTLILRDNHMFGTLTAGLIFNITFFEKSTLDLSNNDICDFDLETYYEDIKKDRRKGLTVLETSIDLEKGAKLDLSNNYIGDGGAKVLMKATTLNEGSILDLSGNHISDEMKEELKEWEKSYHDKGINCQVIV